MLRVKSVAERVADHVVGHHPGMPRFGQPEQAVVAASSQIHALHVPRIAESVSKATDSREDILTRLLAGAALRGSWRITPTPRDLDRPEQFINGEHTHLPLGGVIPAVA